MAKLNRIFFLRILLFNIGIVYVIDLTLNGTITNQVEITTYYDKVINYATFTNTGTSIAVVVALETSSTMAIHITF